ncbi:MAG TPA: hypothetical protein VHE53_00350, partial [Patescibacteria group bacterium]|nr:hypothetical protein [Patescibacteria group bacterium]
LGFGLASPFWLPAMLETKYVSGLQIFDIAQAFTPIKKFFVPTWGFGLSPMDPLNPMSVQLGYADLLGVIIGIFVFIKSKKKKLIGVFIFSYIFVFFMMTKYSLLIWKTIPLISYFQFPWRLLSLEVLIASFLAGSIFSIKIFKNKIYFKYLALFMIVLSVGLSFKYIRAPFYFPRTDQHYLTRSNFTDGTNSPGNAFNTYWLSKGMPKKNKNLTEIISGKGEISLLSRDRNSYTFAVRSISDLDFLVNIAYFPGWKVSVNNRKVQSYERDGIIEVRVPKGSNIVNLAFQNTDIQNFSYAYFLLSLILLVLLGNKTIDIIKR